jgi:hypothetical protein
MDVCTQHLPGVINSIARKDYALEVVRRRLLHRREVSTEDLQYLRLEAEHIESSAPLRLSSVLAKRCAFGERHVRRRPLHEEIGDGQSNRGNDVASGTPGEII